MRMGVGACSLDVRRAPRRETRVPRECCADSRLHECDRRRQLARGAGLATARAGPGRRDRAATRERGPERAAVLRAPPAESHLASRVHTRSVPHRLSYSKAVYTAVYVATVICMVRSSSSSTPSGSDTRLETVNVGSSGRARGTKQVGARARASARAGGPPFCLTRAARPAVPTARIEGRAVALRAALSRVGHALRPRAPRMRRHAPRRAPHAAPPRWRRVTPRAGARSPRARGRASPAAHGGRSGGRAGVRAWVRGARREGRCRRAAKVPRASMRSKVC